MVLAAALLLASFAVVLRLVAQCHARRNTPEGFRAALRWDSGNPEYYVLLAQDLQNELSDLDPDEVVRLYETAVRLSPAKANYWAQLGGAYEWVGRNDDAVRAFEHARLLFPNSPRINWQLGNFYVRAGLWPEALQSFRKSLVNAEFRQAAFDLAWRGGQTNQGILETMISPRSDVMLDYLAYLVRTRRIEAADEVFSRLLALGLPFELEQVLSYFDGLIEAKRLDVLESVWAALAERFPAKIGLHSFESNAITNGDFEAAILNGGLGWRISPLESVSVRLDNLNFFDGTSSLLLEFRGKNNLNYFHTHQYVKVQPNKLYQFTGYMRTAGITSDSGPRFEIFDAYDQKRLFLFSEGLTGTSSWAQQQIVFKTPPGTRLLVVRVARTPSLMFDNQFSGSVWVDRLVLAPAE
jgi:tetratricopeptide (TPR) repeat protein